MERRDIEKIEGEDHFPESIGGKIAGRSLVVRGKIESREESLIAYIEATSSSPTEDESLAERVRSVADNAKNKVAFIARGALCVLALSASAPSFAESGNTDKGGGGSSAPSEQMAYINSTVETVTDFATTLVETKLFKAQESLKKLQAEDASTGDKVDALLGLANGAPFVSKHVPGVKTARAVNELQKAVKEGEGKLEASLDLAKSIPGIAKKAGPLLSVLSSFAELKKMMDRGDAKPGEVMLKFGQAMLDAKTFGVGSIVINLIKNNVDTSLLKEGSTQSEETLPHGSGG